MSLEKNVKQKNPRKRRTWKVIIGAGMFFVALGLIDYFTDTKNNLAPNAIDVGGYRKNTDFTVLSNENFNDDSQIESVIKFYDRDGEYQRFEMEWDERGWPRIIYPTEE